MTTKDSTMTNELEQLIADLRRTQKELVAANINGWGNVIQQAIDTIESQAATIAELGEQLGSVFGWREFDWPADFCRRTAELIAENTRRQRPIAAQQAQIYSQPALTGKCCDSLIQAGAIAETILDDISDDLVHADIPASALPREAGEPVAWRYAGVGGDVFSAGTNKPEDTQRTWTPLYASPPQAPTPRALNTHEIRVLAENTLDIGKDFEDAGIFDFARAIERRLKDSQP